jgi:hypothetical protein
MNAYREVIEALHELWAATKDLTESETGYTPRFTAACKRLRELEKGAATPDVRKDSI